MHRRTILAAAAPLLAAPHLARAQGTNAAAAVTMRLSHQFPTSHHNARVMASFAEAVKAKSGGAIDVQVFPSEQLAKAGDNFPGVARGAFEAACAVNFQWGNTIPEMNGMTLPYVFTELEKIKRFYGSDAAKFLEAALEKRAVKNFMWLYTTRQSIFTSNRKPLVTVEDFKGIKIRGLNALTDNAFTAIGAGPSSMPGPEVPQALQSGVLDAGLTDLSAAVSRRFYEFQKFGTVAPWFTVISHVYVNPRWYNGLKPEHRAILDACAKEAEQEQIGITEKTADDALVELKAKGMTLHLQTADEAKAWTAAMQPPCLAAFQRLAPEGGQKILDLLRAL